MLHSDICPGIEISKTEDKSPDFDQNLKVGSWDYLELISTVAVTFVEATFVLATLSISEISQLLLTRLWLNFKGRFLGLSWTDFNYCSNICPGNICPGNICPYQEHLSCYWPNFDQTLKVGAWDYIELISTVTVTFVEATFVLATFVYIRNKSAVTDLTLTQL